MYFHFNPADSFNSHCEHGKESYIFQGLMTLTEDLIYARLRDHTLG